MTCSLCSSVILDFTVWLLAYTWNVGLWALTLAFLWAITRVYILFSDQRVLFKNKAYCYLVKLTSGRSHTGRKFPVFKAPVPPWSCHHGQPSLGTLPWWPLSDSPIWLEGVRCFLSHDEKSLNPWQCTCQALELSMSWAALSGSCI